MARFSKQWCDLWDPETSYDFDIDNIVKDLSRGRDYPITCEGFGFLCIHKDGHGRVWLSFQQKEGRYTNWTRYSSLMIQQRNKKNNESSSI
jgi:hypothetical protein